MGVLCRCRLLPFEVDRVAQATGELTGNIGEPIHTSTGIFLYRDTQVGNAAKGYSWIARNMEFDHDAILLDGPGAATPDDGVGMMVNSLIDDAKPVAVNAVLSADSYGSRSRKLNDSAREKWGTDSKYAYVEDFDGDTAIISRDGGSFSVGYSLDGDTVIWDESEKPVEQKTSWVDKNAAFNRFLQWMGIGVNSDPSEPNIPEESTDMDRKELDAALAANQTATLDAVKSMLAPLTESLGTLSTNQRALSDSLTANARAAEADKRKVVAERIGVEAADLLTGNALDSAYAKIKGAAPLLPGLEGNGSDAYQMTVPE